MSIKTVQLFKDDFRVINLSLMECITAWRNMIDEGEVPPVPGLDMGKAQHILLRFSEVRDKINQILEGEPITVDPETKDKILELMGVEK